MDARRRGKSNTWGVVVVIVVVIVVVVVVVVVVFVFVVGWMSLTQMDSDLRRFGSECLRIFGRHRGFQFTSQIRLEIADLHFLC